MLFKAVDHAELRFKAVNDAVVVQGY